MTDLEISKALALAIGWTRIIPNGTENVWVCKHDKFRLFDYRDWAAIGPIAERYECFPVKTSTKEWGASINSTAWDRVYADTPQKAIALAVIQGAKK